jgi:uncharacterized protein YndB with AHSA1/START domain
MSPTSNRNAADGTLVHRDGTYILRYERHLRHPLDRVWAALTEPEQIGAWLAEADLDLVAGGAVELRWLNARDEGDRYAAVARGHVTALDPPHLLELDTDVHGLLRWELREEADGTGLTFTVTVALDHDQALSNVAGWHVHLEHLEDALAGRPVDWPHWWDEHYPRWQDLHAGYAARYPEA